METNYCNMCKWYGDFEEDSGLQEEKGYCLNSKVTGKTVLDPFDEFDCFEEDGES